MTAAHVGPAPLLAVRSGAAAVALVAVLALAGCTPEVDGITGVTRDSTGALAGVWESCRGELAGAVLIRDSNTSRSEHIGRWEVSTAATGATWPLQDRSAPRGWEVWRPAQSTLDAGHLYSLFAWRKENVTNALGVDFTVDDLDGLKQGLVLINDRSEGTIGRTLTVTQDEFEKKACSG